MLFWFGRLVCMDIIHKIFCPLCRSMATTIRVTSVWLLADMPDNIVQIVKYIDHVLNIAFLDSCDRRISQRIAVKAMSRWSRISIDAINVIAGVIRIGTPSRSPSVIIWESMPEIDRDINSILSTLDNPVSHPIKIIAIPTGQIKFQSTVQRISWSGTGKGLIAHVPTYMFGMTPLIKLHVIQPMRQCVRDSGIEIECRRRIGITSILYEIPVVPAGQKYRFT